MRHSPAIRSTRDQILEALRNDVLSGKLVAGQRVSEAVLAQRFGVSRGPIRESLSQLASEGLVIAKPNCGVTVAPPPPAELRELILPIRLTLEVYALRKIVTALTNDDFAYWEDVLARMEIVCRQKEWQRFAQLDVELHRSFLIRADQPDLEAIWNAIVTRMRAHFWDTVHLHAAQGTLMSLHAHHVELIDAFRSRNPANAEKALRAHIAQN